MDPTTSIGRQSSLPSDIPKDQVEKLLELKMKMLEREYEQCKKYDDPNYTGQVLELKGHFENNEKGAIEFDDAQKEEKKDLSENQTEKQQEKVAVIAKNPESAEDGEDEEEFQEYYAALPDDDADVNENDSLEQWGDLEKASEVFNQVPHSRDPREVKIDVEKIKQIMSTFTIQPPDWANDKQAWEQKIKYLIKDNLRDSNE